MRSHTLVFAALTLSAPLSLAQAPADPAGHWEGTIEMPRQPVGACLDLAKDPRGGWIGTLGILGTPIVDVPLRRIAVEGGKVRFTAALPDNPAFDGTLSADAAAIDGTASNSMGSVPFSLRRKGPANVKLPAPSSPLTKEFEGAWAGTLDAGGRQLRLALKLTAASDGSATATIVSLDQGQQEILVTSVTIEQKELRFEARGVSGSYKGTLGAGGEIVGEWSQAGAALPLSFKRPPESSR
jgi:hypothetical protein